MFPKNSGTPKSSIFIGFSIIFTIHFRVPLFLETPIYLGYLAIFFLTLTHPPPQKINTQLFVWNWIVQTQTYYNGTWNIYLREFLNGLNSLGNEMKVNIQDSSPMEMGDLTSRHDFGTKNTPLPGLLSFTGNFILRRRPKCRTFQMLNLHLSKLHRERSQSRGMGDGSILKSSQPVLVAPFFFSFLLTHFVFFSKIHFKSWQQRIQQFTYVLWWFSDPDQV